MKLPHVQTGRYGVVSLDVAACGQGFVVDYQASAWVIAQWGDKSRWATFQEFHTAFAYFLALSGLHERSRAGRAVKRSRTDGGQRLTALEAL